MYQNEIKQLNFVKRFGFLFLLLYAIIYILPFPFSFVGIFSSLGTSFNEITWHKIIPIVAENILGIQDEVNFGISGSGDRIINWVQVFVTLSISFTAALFWALFSKPTLPYQKINRWLSSYILCFLICSMIVYGMVKVIKLQFQDPTLIQLTTELGNITPFRLSWIFMGYSDLYTFFGGFGEIMGAVLLVFRKTRTLGALVTFGVMMNVFIMNMSYDIPVKLYSFHLVLCAIFIFAQDFVRLWNLFVLNRTAHPVIFLNHFKNPLLNKIWEASKYILIAAFIILQFAQAQKNTRIYGQKAPVPHLYGIYEVDIFVTDGDTIPPLMTENDRWKTLLIEKNDLALIRWTNEERRSEYYRVETDTINKLLIFNTFQDTINKFRLEYNLLDDQLLLNGRMLGDSLNITMKRRNHLDYPLLKRGFNWVNEYPY